jgi:hypothetical protein
MPENSVEIARASQSPQWGAYSLRALSALSPPEGGLQDAVQSHTLQA